MSTVDVTGSEGADPARYERVLAGTSFPGYRKVKLKSQVYFIHKNGNYITNTHHDMSILKKDLSRV